MRTMLGAALACVVALAGCGGGGSDASGTASVRVVNASGGYGLLDFHVDDSLALSSVASGQASSYVSVSSGTHDTSFTRSGASTALHTQSRTFSGDSAVTVLAYGWEGALKTFHLIEDEASPDAGKAKLRTVNTASDAGSLDVYVTAVTDSLADASAVNMGVGGNGSSDYATITQGTYRIRVTAAGDKTDLRLDVTGVALSSQEVATLVITPTTGGVLVNALLMEQKGAVTAYANTTARARLVAAMAGNAGVAATLGSTTLSSGSRSPLIGSYVTVPAGLLPLDVKVNGEAVGAGSAAVAPGADLSVVVHGSAEAPVVTVLSDDNRLPATSGKAKLRLVHAVSGLGAGVTLVSNYSALLNDVGYGSASSYALLGYGTQSQIEVTSPASTSSLFSASDVELQSDGVYTLFMMAGASAPVGALRKDR